MSTSGTGVKRRLWLVAGSGLAVIFFLSLIVGTAQVRPVVNAGGVLNAASYALAGMPNEGIAQGSMFVVFGRNLGPDVLLMVPRFPLSAELGGTSIRVTVAGTTVSALPVYTSAGQVAAILPSNTPLGDGTLTVSRDNLTSAPVNVRVVGTSLGVFSRNQAGMGPAIVQNHNSAGDQPINSILEVAHPGQIMVLWGTGLGPVPFDETVPPQVMNLDVPVEVLVGTKTARVLYKGRSSEFPGVDQINVQLPDDVESGCYVPLAVRAGRVLSNFTSIAIAPEGRVCSDPHGVPASELSRLRAGGTLNLGSIQLIRLSINGNISPFGNVQGGVDFGFGDFFRWDAATAVSSYGINPGVQLPMGTCAVYPAMPEIIVTTGAFRPNRLNIGSELTLSGPAGVKLMPRRAGSGLYDRQPIGIWSTPSLPMIPASFSAYLEPGSYVAHNGAGRAEFGPFHASLETGSGSFIWTNREQALSVNRGSGVTITWTGGDPAREYVVLGGVATIPDMINMQVGGLFVCAESVSAGRFSVPSSILAALPGSSSFYLGVGTAPLLADRAFVAQGLDKAYFTYTKLNVGEALYR